MKRPHRFLAFDLGAQSGRAMLGELDGRRSKVREASPFPNRMLELNGHLFWDIWRLLDEVGVGMRESLNVRQFHPNPTQDWDRAFERFSGL